MGIIGSTGGTGGSGARHILLRDLSRVLSLQRKGIIGRSRTTALITAEALSRRLSVVICGGAGRTRGGCSCSTAGTDPSAALSSFTHLICWQRPSRAATAEGWGRWIDVHISIGSCVAMQGVHQFIPVPMRNMP